MPSAESDDRRERRAFIKVAVAFTALIVVMTVTFALLYRAPATSTPSASRTAESGMSGIDRPDAGRKPMAPGDRGGSEQLALLGLLIVAIAGGAGGLVLSSRRAKRRTASAVEGVGEHGIDGATDH